MQKLSKRFKLPAALYGQLLEFCLAAMLPSRRSSPCHDVACRPARDRRSYQDYSSWQSFGTANLWEEIEKMPHLAGEIIAQHLNKLLLKNPSGSVRLIRISRTRGKKYQIA